MGREGTTRPQWLGQIAGSLEARVFPRTGSRARARLELSYRPRDSVMLDQVVGAFRLAAARNHRVARHPPCAGRLPRHADDRWPVGTRRSETEERAGLRRMLSARRLRTPVGGTVPLTGSCRNTCDDGGET